jgi:hypothetical protein
MYHLAFTVRKGVLAGVHADKEVDDRELISDQPDQGKQ